MATEVIERETETKSSQGNLGFRVVGILVIAFAFALRVFHLGNMGLEYDEAFAIHAAFQGLGGILKLVTTTEPHPPLYYSLLWLWYPVVGATEFALRIPTVFFNLLSIVFLLKIADQLNWRLAGLIGALLFAVNPYQVWYAQEARMYAPVACFGAAAVYFALRALRFGRNRDLAGYVIFVVLCLFTHYYGMFLAVFINALFVAGLLWLPSTALNWRRWFSAQVIVAACFLPWLAFAARITTSYIRAVPDSVDEWAVVKDSLAVYSLGTSIPRPEAMQWSLGFLLVIVVGTAVACLTGGRFPRWFRGAFIVGYLLLPLTIGAFVSLFRSMFDDRYFMVSAPAFFLLLGLGVAGLLRKIWPVGITALALLLVGQSISLRNYYFDPHYDKAELAKAINYVLAHARPGDGIILDGWSQQTQFWYYDAVRASHPLPGYVLPLQGTDGWQQTPAKIDEIMHTHPGIWLLDYGRNEVDAGQRVENYLARDYYQSLYQPIISNRVVYYTGEPVGSSQMTPIGASCNGQLLLQDVTSQRGALRAGEVLPLALRWQALTTLSTNYVVSWRLVDSAGHTVLQRDSQQADGFAPSQTWKANQVVVDRYGMLIPSFLPPGQYSAVVVVYDQANGAACQWRRGNTILPSTELPLRRVDVTDTIPLPPLGPAKPKHSLAVRVAGLTLIGYDLEDRTYRPGDVASLRLYWRVNTPMAANLSVQAKLTTSQRTAIEAKPMVLGNAFPTSRWQGGRTVAAYVDVPIPVTAVTGPLQATLQFAVPGGPPIEVSNFPALKVIARPRTYTAPPIPVAKQADFAGSIALLGYGLRPATDGTIKPGQTIDLNMYWKDVKGMNTSYKVFTHLLGPDGRIYGQEDAIPLNGNAPTNGWLPGEILTDHYQIAVAANAPPGNYQIVVGFYDPISGARLSLADGKGDTLALTSLHLVSQP